eukprot:CAMPEP_0118999746 /NCGR_PEP_ID=MMETSP1173-20130426/63733_1 /TAXON_ID=1034831 /ORGANISM="Rhizochromulina marina cf, Strain CCMP1243" /LENGTH=134 /DNA_ID=CAMNT_0006951249 /DNA_START=1141 /DNA_END=1542 /DNA_ORIENTATION=-
MAGAWRTLLALRPLLVPPPHGAPPPSLQDSEIGSSTKIWRLSASRSLTDVANAKKTKATKLNPFSDEVLAFMHRDAKALDCAHRLDLFRGEGSHGGRFRLAHDTYKKTTGQVISPHRSRRSFAPLSPPCSGGLA